MTYDYRQQFNATPIMSIGDSVKLPLPRKINDFNFQMWEEWSATAHAAAAAKAFASFGLSSSGISTGILGSVLGSIVGDSIQLAEMNYGVTINPGMFMLYKRPAFKEHELSWLLAANNEEESKTLKKIIDMMKYHSLPDPISEEPSALWGYPSTCMVTLKPDKYTFKFRPAVIVAVSVDYHAAGTPSYFKSSAPTVVSLSIRLKEISFWTKANFGQIGAD